MYRTRRGGRIIRQTCERAMLAQSCSQFEYPREEFFGRHIAFPWLEGFGSTLRENFLRLK